MHTVVGIVSAASKQYFSKVLSFEPMMTQGENGAPHTQWRVTEVCDIGKRIVTSEDAMEDLHLEGMDDMELAKSIDAQLAGDCEFPKSPDWVRDFVHCKGSATSRSSIVLSAAKSSDSSCNASNSEMLHSIHSGGSYMSGTGKNLHGLSFSQIQRLFPCHVVFNSRLVVVQMGQQMGRFMEGFGVGERMNEHFAVTTPNVSWSKRWDDLEAICTAQPEFEIVSLARRSRQGNGISFSGPLSFSDDGQFAIFLCCPNVRSFDDMYDYKVSMTDMAAYGCRLQMVLQEDHLIHAQETTARLQRLTEEVNAEKEKTVKLMQDVAEKAEEALATKKTFVRYVSHEIRTPLTVAKLGLMLVDKEVESALGSSNEKESEILAHLKDCEQSLDIAVSILDDLLSYEKLESGIYELFKDVVPAVSFVETSIRMFSIQVSVYSAVVLFPA